MNNTNPPGPPYQLPPNQPEQLAGWAYPPPPPPPKKKRWKLILLIVVAGFIPLLIISACIASLASVSSTGKHLAAATTEPDTTDPATPSAPVTRSVRSKSNIEKSDIKLHVKTLSKKCYGSIGCNVEYRVVVDGAHMSDWPKSGEVEVGYKVIGPEDGPEDDSFIITLDDGQYEKPWEEVTSTRSRGTKLTIKVTDVEYSE